VSAADVPLLIRLRGITRTYGQGATAFQALKGVDLDIAAGEFVAIMGPSGSGKSTVMNLLGCLDTPSSGAIRLLHTETHRMNGRQRAMMRRKSLGFVFQSFHLLPALTALENTMLPLELTGQQDAAGQARVWLERVGLGHRLQHLPRQLSGGEQQRVALARAFAATPRLVMADEPTGNLDPVTGRQIIDLMFDLNRTAGTTLLLVTHDEAIAGRCQRRLRIAEGRLVEDWRLA